MVVIAVCIVFAQEQYGIRVNCPEVWAYLDSARDVLRNPLYVKQRSAPGRGRGHGTDAVFLPPLSQLIRNVTLWSDYFCRWSPAPSSPPGPPEELGNLLYEEGM